MRGSAAKEGKIWPAVVAVAALLLSAPHAFASRTAPARPDLLTAPVLQPITATQAIAPTYAPQGFALRLDAGAHPATFALFNDLTPASERVEPEKLASGVESWDLTPNIQRIQIFVAESWQVREFLGPIDSPNLYQAFGLDPQNNTDPLGLQEGEPTCVKNKNCAGTWGWWAEKFRGWTTWRKQPGAQNPDYGEAAGDVAELQQRMEDVNSFDKGLATAGAKGGRFILNASPGWGNVLGTAEAIQDWQQGDKEAAVVRGTLANANVVLPIAGGLIRKGGKALLGETDEVAKLGGGFFRNEIERGAGLSGAKLPLKEFDIDFYGSFNVVARKGDDLIGHEMLQNAWLKANGLVAKSHSGPISARNPAVAVTDAMHKALNREQIRLGLTNPAKLAAMSAEENLARNAEAMRSVGIPEHVIQVLWKEAGAYATAVVPK